MRQDLPGRKDASFHLWFDDNPLPIWLFEQATWRFLDVNLAAVAQYGYTREEFLQMDLADIRPAEDVPRLREAMARPGSHRPSGQWRHRLKDGRVIDVEVAAHTVMYAGRPAVFAILQNVTERTQLEERLRQATKMEAVGVLAGGIAHDFNNLLTIINGYSHILLNALSTNDPNRAGVEQIMKAGERAAGLTSQLLGFSRRQAPQPKVLSVNQLVGGMESMLRRLIGEDIDLVFVPGDALGHVRADPGMLEQVVMNLAVNARDAMPRGGTLTIETGNADLGESRVSTHTSMRAGEYVVLVVSDNGAGMDSETRARLFQPFFTTKERGKGTGLGLTTVLGIVKQSGGGVEVSSEPGKGTSIKIYLPRVDQSPAHEIEKPDTKTSQASETILLVEDEELVRNLVRDTLARQGYRVLDASNAREARRICATHAGRIALLISDVVMPKEGGRELADSLANMRPEMKVLFMSGYTDQSIRESRLAVRESAFIQKPFTPAMLVQKVREILARNGGDSMHSAGR